MKNTLQQNEVYFIQDFVRLDREESVEALADLHRLADAIRAGCLIAPEMLTEGTYLDRRRGHLDRVEASALGCAALAGGLSWGDDERDIHRWLHVNYPGLFTGMVINPLTGLVSPQPVVDVVSELNDDCPKSSREDIADWLASLELAPEPELDEDIGTVELSVNDPRLWRSARRQAIPGKPREL